MVGSLDQTRRTPAKLVALSVLLLLSAVDAGATGFRIDTVEILDLKHVKLDCNDLEYIACDTQGVIVLNHFTQSLARIAGGEIRATRKIAEPAIATHYYNRSCYVFSGSTLRRFNLKSLELVDSIKFDTLVVGKMLTAGTTRFVGRYLVMGGPVLRKFGRNETINESFYCVYDIKSRVARKTTQSFQDCPFTNTTLAGCSKLASLLKVNATGDTQAGAEYLAESDCSILIKTGGMAVNAMLSGRKPTPEQYFIYDKEMDTLWSCPLIGGYQPCGCNYNSIVRLQSDTEAIFLSQETKLRKLLFFRMAIPYTGRPPVDGSLRR